MHWVQKGSLISVDVNNCFGIAKTHQLSNWEDTSLQLFILNSALPYGMGLHHTDLVVDGVRHLPRRSELKDAGWSDLEILSDPLSSWRTLLESFETTRITKHNIFLPRALVRLQLGCLGRSWARKISLESYRKITVCLL